MKTLKGRLTAAFAVVAIIAVAGAGYVFATGATIVPRTAQAAPALYSQDTVTSIFDAASPAVVEIDVTLGGGRFGGMSAQGSGFLVDTNGDIMTNEHVVDGATSVKVIFKDGKSATGTVAGTDTADDLAIVKVDASAVAGVTPLQFADSSQLKPGQMAIAIGTPYGLDETITVGVVSGLNRSVSGTNMTGMVQTDAAINHGNSGGPLLDANGQVIGINTAIEAAQGSVGIGFAVPSNVASKQMPSLIAGKTVSRPYLGISGMALTSDLAKTLGLSVDKGVYVITVVQGGPAEKAGLKAGGTDQNGNPGTGGDVITAVDGKAVASITDLSSYLSANKSPGDTVSLTVLRGGSSITVGVTLGTWPTTQSQSPQPQMPNQSPNQSPMPWPFGPGGGGRYHQGN